MKSEEANETKLSSEPVISVSPDSEELDTAVIQLNPESMDGDSKKTQAYTPNRRTGYRDSLLGNSNGSVALYPQTQLCLPAFKQGDMLLINTIIVIILTLVEFICKYFSHVKLAGYIKYVSLVVLTVQNAALGLSMRYATTRDIEMFSPAAAVLMAEVFKLIICIGLVMQESGGVEKGARSMYNIVILNVKDTLRVCVPSFLYIVQNNLLYLSAANLDAATYQVTYQLKILTTAFFAVVVLKRQLKKWQWAALALLAAGVALVQLSSSSKSQSSSTSVHEQSKLIGFSAALAACFISGFAGIYFEKVLKESDISVWMRNVQLSLLSLPFGTGTYLIKEGISSNLLKGFDGFVWYLVILQAAGGLIVAVVVKYADNILKGFATSVAILISCVVSMYIFDFVLTVQFSIGTMLVMASIFLYGYVPKKPEPRSSLSV